MNPAVWDPMDNTTWKYPGIEEMGVCFYCLNAKMIKDGDYLYCQPDGPKDR